MSEADKAKAARAAEHALTIYVEDPELKRRMKRLAADEDRSLANWFTHHFIGHVEGAVAELEKKAKRQAR